jgi:antitoxin component YwqK of YwqJK toxin-antitoxin module
MILRLLVMSLFLSIRLTASACMCMTDAFSAKNALSADYVALVKVVRVAAYQRQPTKYAEQPYYTAEIQEVKRYKGEPRQQLVVSGGLPSFNTWTSCDMGIDVGEEWLVFGTVEEATFVYPCGYTTQFRATNGFQELQRKEALTRVHMLDSLTNQPVTQQHLSGEVLSRYPNQVVQKSEHFRKGVLHGTAAYFYPDGQPYATMSYKKGRLDGHEKWYTATGQLQRAAIYRRGTRRDTATFYYAMRTGDSLPHLRYIYNKKGQPIKSQQFRLASTGQYLSQETDYEPAISKETNKYYYPSGQLRSLGYRLHNKSWGLYQEFDEQGRVTHQWQYDGNGRTIKPSINSKN